MPADWDKIKDAFVAALAREGESRQRYLDQLDSRSPGLRAEVERLLDGYESSTLLESPAGAPDWTGKSFGHYRILGKAGSGGMGLVFHAEDVLLRRKVALKFLRIGVCGDLQEEARTLAALSHPHICTLYDACEDGGLQFLVFEYVEGEPVRGPMGVEDWLRCAIGLTSALEHAHARGFVHKDLKPDNILRTRFGVKLLDFGLACVRAERPGQVAGTPAYMAPEQQTGAAAAPASDMYSLGLILIELLTGRQKRVAEWPVLPHPRGGWGVSGALLRLLRCCIESETPEGRPTAAEMLAALQEEDERQRRKRQPAWRRSGWMLSAAVAVLAAMVWFMGVPGSLESITLEMEPPEGSRVAAQ